MLPLPSSRCSSPLLSRLLILYCFTLCCLIHLVPHVLAKEEQPEDAIVKKAAADQQHQRKHINRPDVAFCEGTTSAFFVSDNISIDDAAINASSVIRGIPEAECVQLCAHNRDNKGRTVLCSSLVYASGAQECRLYRLASFPDGELARKATEGKRFFEKFCLADDAPAECEHKQFVRVDDYILKGYAQSTTTVATMGECVAYCVREREFQCKSAMYFYEEGECITNAESAITAPDDFQRPDDDDKVVFFHNGCLQQQQQQSANNEDEEGNNDGGEQQQQPELAHSQDSESIPDTSISTAQQTIGTTVNANNAQQQQQEWVGTTEGGNGGDAFYSASTLANEKFAETASSSGFDGALGEQSTTAATTTRQASDQPPNYSSSPAQFFTSLEPTTNNNEGGGEGGAEPGNDGQQEQQQQLAARNDGQNEEMEMPETTSAGPRAVPIPPAVTADSILAQQGEQQQQQFHPKQLKVAAVDKQQEQQQQRLYGAKTIERASDGSFQEKSSNADNSNKSSSNLPSSAPNRKRPESTKRLHLKLIKEQQQQQPKKEISENILPSTASPVLPNQEEQQQEQQQQQSSSPIASSPSSTSPLPSEEIVPTTAASTTEGRPNLLQQFEQREQQQRKQILVPVPEQSAEEHFEGAEGYFSRWGPWTPCNVPGERRVRRRKCLDLRRCKGALMQVDYCPRDIPPPPVDELPSADGDDDAQLQQQQRQRQNTAVPIAVTQQQNEQPAPPPQSPTNRRPIPIDVPGGESNGGGALPPSIVPPSQQEVEQPPKIVAEKPEQKDESSSVGAPAPRPDDEFIWSQWNGTCQHFASSQPCKDGEVIGFESRECIARDPLICKGPFFRYCTLPC